MKRETSSQQLRGMAPIIGALWVAILLVTFLKSRIVGGHLIDGQGFFLGRDFLNFWHYGMAAWSEDPSLWYDRGYYNDILARILDGYDYGEQIFSYPPHYMLLAAPFSLVGYYWALAGFTLVGLVSYWVVVARPFADTAYRAVLMTAPPLLIGLICGQVSLLLAVLFVLIFRQMDKRPVVAGVLIALMTVKPQVGFLFPVFLIATGRYQVFAAAAVGTVLFMGASVLIHGTEVWEVFLLSGTVNQSGALVHSHPWTLGLMPTIFVNAVIAGLPLSLGVGLHSAAVLVVVAVMVRVVRREGDPMIAYAVFVAASFVATPYLMVYDTLVLVWVALSVAAITKMSEWQSMSLRLLLALGPLGMVLSVVGVPGSALLTIAIFCWTVSVSSTGLRAFRRGDERPTRTVDA